jgi:hypothetical protein
MDTPEPLRKLRSLIENKGWAAAIRYEAERKLQNYPNLEEKPDTNPLAEAYRQVEVLKREKDLNLRQKETWKLVAIMLDGRILQKNIRESHIMERINDETNKSTINRSGTDNIRSRRGH